MTQLLDAARTDLSQFSGKETLLRVLGQEFDTMIGNLRGCDDAQWSAQTCCTEWQVRDVAGHLLDVAFGYVGYFRMAREGYPAEAPRGMRIYAEQLGESAKQFRDLSRYELIARLQALMDDLFDTFRGMDEAAWTSSAVVHKWAGPIPGFMFPTFGLMDYSVHNWDVQQAMGQQPRVDPEAADLLVPFMFGLRQICFDDQAPELADLEVEIDIDGRPDDRWTATVKGGAFAFAPGAPPAPQAVFRFRDPGEFALDAYQRFHGGEATGDQAAIEEFRRMFFTI